MCGIAGFLEWATADRSGGAGARPRLERMLQAVEHRGPDDWGMAFFGLPADCRDRDRGHVRRQESQAACLALGHRRLSILDLSPRGRQPMATADGSLTITYNGEIYNYVELREELGREGAAFHSGTDTEVLLEAYRRWGGAMLGRLDGMFAFAIWDAREGKLLCARDPFGIKPFYYGRDGRRFVFASEPRAVLAGLGTPGHIDVPRSAEFLVLGLADHDGGTAYREVGQLPGGHWMEVDAVSGISEPRPFWRPPNDVILDGEDPAARVREQIALAVRRQLRADVPVGSCLSGGLDSGSIVATIGQLLGERAAGFTTFTIANPGFERDEASRARVMAKWAGMRWVGVEPDIENFGADLERLVRVQGEPFASLSIYAQYKVMQCARRHGMTVMLDGQGGDEVFIGYQRVATRVIEEHLRYGRVGSALHEWRQLSRNAAIPMAQAVLYNVYFNSPRLVRLYKGRLLKPLVDHDWIRQVRPQATEQYYRCRGIRSLQLTELTCHPLPTLLRYEDRNSMAFGLEARVPMLSVGLVDLCLSLPWHWKVRNGWTKYVLRDAMRGRLPEEVLWHRHKHGFEVPQKLWVERARPQLAAWLSELPRDCPVDGAAILDHIDAGRGGDSNLWRCLSLALWMRSEGVRV
ncbi:MAG: asparagine synthase (glutamine-hydrolyzing), partial [Solirubrobacterales bacterium]|nr:asparagine synthase (glutamine-hydrolyzing) [Solirubrobacterales bacterium]